MSGGRRATASATRPLRRISLPPREATGVQKATWSYELLDLVPPRLASRLPLAGMARQFSQVELWFDEPVQGIDATDLMANGLTAKAVSGTGPGRICLSSTSRRLAKWS